MGHEHRKGEFGAVPARTDRFFCVGGEWYFTTREDQTHGPFDSKGEAEASLALFLTRIDTSAQTG